MNHPAPATHAALDTDRDRRPAPETTRAAGLILIVAAIVSIVFVALDPEVRVHGPRAVIAAIAANAGMHRLVHAVELACVLGLGFAFASLAARVGPKRPAVLIGTLAYLAGCGAMIVAAVCDGFITSDVATIYAAAGKDPDLGYALVQFSYLFVQDFATASWAFQSIGVLAMAGALVADGGVHRRVGFIGLATGAAPIALIAANYPVMCASVVVTILLAQGVWNIASAVLLLRRPGGVRRQSLAGESRLAVAVAHPQV